MEYITIAEYAERAKISKQSAYKRAKSEKYKRYFRRNKNGVLMVDSDILILNQNFNRCSTEETEEGKTVSGNPFNQNSTTFSTVENSMLREMIERQDEQIKSLSSQIENLYSMISEKDGIIKDISANMAQITAQFQALQHEKNLLEAGKAQAETAPPVEEIPTERETSAERPKKGFLSRFWKR